MSQLASVIAPREACAEQRIESLPIVVLHIHNRCNCRCTMCDIWQNRQTRELSVDRFRGMMSSFERLGVRWAVLTGGEPLLHTDIAGVCTLLRSHGIKVTVLTTGLLLSRYAEAAAELFDEIIVSLDGPPSIHDGIRRVSGGFDRIAVGLAEVRRHAPTIPLRARSTVQKANYRYLRETVRAANVLPLDSISFLAADLTSTAFNRELVWPTERQNEIGLSVEDVIALDDEIELLITECNDELRSGFIVESPSKLRRIVQHFRAHLGMATPRAPICNAPWTSAVVELDGRVRPCFFHAPIGNLDKGNLEDAINGELGRSFRAGLDILTNPTCQRCVCSLNYRES